MLNRNKKKIGRKKNYSIILSILFLFPLAYGYVPSKKTLKYTFMVSASCFCYTVFTAIKSRLEDGGQLSTKEVDESNKVLPLPKFTINPLNWDEATWWAISAAVFGTASVVSGIFCLKIKDEKDKKGHLKVYQKKHKECRLNNTEVSGTTSGC